MKRNVYVIGDLHGDFNLLQNSLSTLNFNNLSKDDILFVSGDAGFINSLENKNSKNKRIEILNKLPFTIIVILGNHENYDIIESFKEVKIFNGFCYKEDDVAVYYAKNGQIFDIDGDNFFTFNGGLSADKIYREELEKKYHRKFYFKQEIKEEDFEASYNKFIKEHIDYVITHDVPEVIFKQMIPFISNIKNKECSLQTFFQKLYETNNFKHWYAGHYHPKNLLNIDNVTILPIGYLLQIK